ncbi:cytochrome c oxidase subunit 7A2, mitochondrial-like [Palaemon carinicauda]|uniref:cytochrome c oxidase subunit 7A2, mitochondrial-like n=1 Tax=Palaemon carinicauda TaxID=392227 RepID=UPI0035B61345
MSLKSALTLVRLFGVPLTANGCTFKSTLLHLSSISRFIFLSYVYLGRPTLLVPCGAQLKVRSSQATLSTSSRHAINYSPVPKPLKGKMKLFQMPNGLPVHIKGGPVDRILFAITAIICTVGLIDCFHVYYVLFYPKKKE